MKGIMIIKKGLKDVYANDEFFYCISDGGYVKPEEVLENEEDVKKVKEAIAVIKDFEKSCEDQIEGFIQ